MGRDVRKNATNANGGSGFGIALRTPCISQEFMEGPPLFQCPNLDRKTDEDVEREVQEAEEAATKLFAGFGRVSELKQMMIDKQLRVAKANCPWCEGKDTLILNCAINYNNHVHCKCTECEQGFME